MKSLGKVALVGVSGLVLFKVSTALVFPVFGMLFGLLSLAVKFVAIVAIGYFVYEWLTKQKSDVEVHEVHEEVEVEIDS